MNMNVSRNQRKRVRMESAVREILAALSRLLLLSGIAFRIKVVRASTGSVYLKIRVFDAEGVRIVHHGAAIRISHHAARDANRRGRINFSRPAQRYYGVSCFADSHRIGRKVRRIAENLLRRLPRLEGGEA